MAQQVQHTETSTMIKATKVADYIVERIAAEGISHCFGVAGDYVFPICDAVDSSAKVKWIGCANELNASYAADGYARIRGAAMSATACSAISLRCPPAQRAVTRSLIRRTASSKWSASSRRRAATISRPISPSRRITRYPQSCRLT